MIQKRIREDGQCGFSYNLRIIKGWVESNKDQGNKLNWVKSVKRKTHKW